MEQSHLGPGSSDGYIKPFGATAGGTIKLDKSAKYEFKPDRNPAVGTYDIEGSIKKIKPKPYEAFIGARRPEKPREQNPDPYTGHLKGFAEGLKKTVDIQNSKKYKFKPESTPAPGTYDWTAADSIIKERSKSAVIKEPVSSYRRPAEKLPEPGQYSGHLAPFASHLKNTVNIDRGSKFTFKPDSNPAPGQYDITFGENHTKERPRSAVIREPLVK